MAKEENIKNGIEKEEGISVSSDTTIAYVKKLLTSSTANKYEMVLTAIERALKNNPFDIKLHEYKIVANLKVNSEDDIYNAEIIKNTANEDILFTVVSDYTRIYYSDKVPSVKLDKFINTCISTGYFRFLSALLLQLEQYNEEECIKKMKVTYKCLFDYLCDDSIEDVSNLKLFLSDCRALLNKSLSEKDITKLYSTTAKVLIENKKYDEAASIIDMLGEDNSTIDIEFAKLLCKFKLSNYSDISAATSGSFTEEFNLCMTKIKGNVSSDYFDDFFVGLCEKEQLSGSDYIILNWFIENYPTNKKYKTEKEKFYVLLGRYAVSHGLFDEAKEYYDAAIKLNNLSIYSYIGLFMCSYKVKNYLELFKRTETFDAVDLNNYLTCLEVIKRLEANKDTSTYYKKGCEQFRNITDFQNYLNGLYTMRTAANISIDKALKIVRDGFYMEPAPLISAIKEDVGNLDREYAGCYKIVYEKINGTQFTTEKMHKEFKNAPLEELTNKVHSRRMAFRPLFIATIITLCFSLYRLFIRNGAITSIASCWQFFYGDGELMLPVCIYAAVIGLLITIPICKKIKKSSGGFAAFVAGVFIFAFLGESVGFGGGMVATGLGTMLALVLPPSIIPLICRLLALIYPIYKISEIIKNREKITKEYKKMNVKHTILYIVMLIIFALAVQLYR